jgi:hypothetical protein
MTRIVVVLGIAGSLIFAGTAARADGSAKDPTKAGVALPGAHAVPLFNAEHANKIREEIRINEGRAKELEPVIARDRQARNDVEADWKVLERHAREMRARANELRQMATSEGGKGQQDLNTYANDFEAFATRDEENARFKHEIAERLEKNIQGEVAARDWHLKTAQRLREWLQANGA